MRDSKIVLRGWSDVEKDRRNMKLGYWHDDWASRWEDRVEFRPEDWVGEESDYNLHHVDAEAPLEARIEFGDRSNEISGSQPTGTRKLRVPTGAERLRGAMVAAAVGDAFADECNDGALKKYPWKTGRSGKGELLDYLPNAFASPTYATQLLASSGEGLLRALGGRRTGNQVDPVASVQHAFQRWLYYMKRDWEKLGIVDEWPIYGGVFARGTREGDGPDGTVLDDAELCSNRHPDPTVVDALMSFADTGIRSTPTDPRSNARGGAVLVRAALAAVWSENLSETFDLATSIAALTHPHPDDCLAAGAMAVVLHQQIRDRPFMDCVSTAYDELVRRPDHEKTRLMMSRAVLLAREERVPADMNNVRRYFEGCGTDGAEALGVALYCAMSSDYLREGLLLALNYAADRCAVAAATGMLVGAEYGIQAVPRVFLEPIKSAPTLDTLAHDLATELRDVLTDKEWLRRYPPT